MTDDGADTTGHLQIGAVATETGLSIKTIRHYDEVGLVIPSARSAGGFRLYTRADVDRLFVIRRMKPLGFTLDDMRKLLNAEGVLDDADASSADRGAALETLADFRERARHAGARLERQLDYARELTTQLSNRLGDRPSGLTT
ncbi:MerR family transcriptional regulator [Gordonia sp. KTR9]|uniref:MerR family transcriptional regulator n=1 Tax=Gordonia sp. KTR9 TaxID=337191 RepID=UPI00027DD7B9|nr:MerR family transcriptional regulator [Gordonia sp. KTR9]AFR47862.1 putative transcriptional regulators [Gordonia sp. KTR9]